MKQVWFVRWCAGNEVAFSTLELAMDFIKHHAFQPSYTTEERTFHLRVVEIDPKDW